MGDQITNYKCPACTGPLHFGGGSGQMECEYCGSIYPVDEIEKLYEAADEKAVDAMAKADKAFSEADEWEISSGQWGEDGMKAYNCPSCGAQLMCEETMAAASCPYCGNPTVVPGQFSGMLKPDYVVPFKLEKNAAIEALKRHYGGKYLLPKSFKDQNHLQEVKGVYVPFWLYDGTTEGLGVYEGTKEERHRRGDEETIITRYYNIQRQGGLAFERIPADASSKMPDDLMDSIEPYDYREMKEFKKAYLTGYLADKYDVTAEENAERAVSRAKESTKRALQADVQGYDSLRPLSENVRVEQGKVSYAMMPVWLLSTRWNNQNFLFAMNGQTGRMVGDLPVDKTKLWLTVLAVFAACVLGLGVIMDLGMGAGIIGGIIISAIVGFVLVSSMKSVAKAVAADGYISKGSISITGRADRFVREERRVVHHDND